MTPQKRPIPALRFFPQPLRRAERAPHPAGFARLELGRFTKSLPLSVSYASINVGSEVARVLGADRCA